MAFRHVEALRRHGFDAFVAPPGAGEPGWFETDAPVIDIPQRLRDDDVLVFPENHPDMLRGFGGVPNRKVIFCQSYIMAFRGVGSGGSYSDLGVTDLLCPGEYAASYCRRRFPEARVSVVPVQVDIRLFSGALSKKLQIAYMPDKRPREAEFIRDLFRAENSAYRRIPWLEISGWSEADVAAGLRESAVFLSLCRFEACPLSLLEALSCGCIVAGFTGFGGGEYAASGNGFWAPDDDCIAAAGELANAVRLAVRGGRPYRAMREAAEDTAAGYSAERFEGALLTFWGGSGGAVLDVASAGVERADA